MSEVVEDKELVALIYSRTSSIAQTKKGHGLASQETRCREFARMKGYEVEKVFSDKAVSGGMVDRPGIVSMLNHIRDAGSNVSYVVIIDDISRWARDIRAHLDLRDAIADAGAILESPSVEFGEDSDSILVENLLASVSQHQRQKGAEQTKNRMRARMMNGYWPFKTVIGFEMKAVAGRGKMLVRAEPLASIIQEAIEGAASGRFQTQAEVKRFLQHQPAFPKNRFGIVTDEAANRILNRVIYAGMVEAPYWDVSLRKGQHEGLVSYETFLSAQKRLGEVARAPARADLSKDFILRGSVACACCGRPLTANWSKSKTGVRHPYYLCFNKGCDLYRKSIRRDQIEGDFAELLGGLTPSRKLVTFAFGMFRDIWDQFGAQTEAIKKQLTDDLAKVDKAIEGLLDRIVEASNPSVVGAYEKRIAKLERDKLVMTEKLENAGATHGGFREMFELSMDFIANPRKLWDSGVIEHRQTVLKLCFAETPRYCRERGFSNPEKSIPFRLLEGISGDGSLMAERQGFEPWVLARAQRFSRPPRSTTPAPLQTAANTLWHPSRQD